MCKVAIMQPHFLPYYGFFKLMKEADKFILLDNVQFSKQSWQQRNKVNIDGKDTWLTVPVKQKMGQLINEVEIDDHDKMYHMQNELKEKLNYSLDFKQKYTLLDVNLTNIVQIKNMLNIDTEILNASPMGEKDIVKLCEMVGATQYISTGGSRVYFDDNLENEFLKRNIAIKFNDYDPDYSIIQYLNDKEYLKEKELINESMHFKK